VKIWLLLRPYLPLLIQQNPSGFGKSKSGKALALSKAKQKLQTAENYSWNHSSDFKVL